MLALGMLPPNDGWFLVFFATIMPGIGSATLELGACEYNNSENFRPDEDYMQTQNKFG